MRRIAPWLLPALAAALVAPIARGDGGDGWLFVAAGRTLLSSHWERAFADPAIQVGPLQLLLYGSVGRSPTALAIVLGVAVALLVVAAGRAAGVNRVTWIGLAAVAAGLTRTGFDSGHPADTLLPLLWIIAAADARRGRITRAALIVGLSAGIETWGILGLAVLAPRLRAIAAAVGTAALLFLPFVAAGHFAMGSFHWQVSPHSFLALVVAPGTTFGWPLRLAQGAFALGTGLLALRTRSLWLAPAVIVVARLLVDPLDNLYYFVGIEGQALVGLALTLQTFAQRRLNARPVVVDHGIPG
jgi:hypothetical protein